MWDFIFADLYMTLQYLPLGIIIALAILILSITVAKIRGKRVEYEKIFIWTLFVIYIIAIMQIAYFSREPGSRSSIDLTLFGTWGASPMARSFVIENVIMFIPFGFLVPAVWKSMRKFHLTVLASLVGTIIIETMQLITQRGYCQLDDVVMNTLGGCIGYLSFYIVKKLVRR